MNANSAEITPSALPNEESAPPARINWVEEVSEYLTRLAVVAFGGFVGLIAAYIIALGVGWVGICG